MRVLRARRVLTEQEGLDLWTGEPAEATPNITSAAEPTLVLDENDDPLMVVARMTSKDRAALRRAVMVLPQNIVPRAASGGASSRSAMVGWLRPNAMLGRNYCAPAVGARKTPAAHLAAVNAAGPCADLMATILPERTDQHRDLVSIIDAGYLLPGGLWTSGIVNYTAPYFYHRDRNNVPGTWSAMPVLRRGTRGGHLAFPEYEIDGQIAVAACADGDVLLFEGQRIIHGVTPITIIEPDGYRITTVYYAVDALRHCPPCDEQLAVSRVKHTH